MSDQTLALLGFAATDFLSERYYQSLKAYFGSLEQAWRCDNKQEFVQAGISPRSVNTLLKRKTKINPEQVAVDLKKCGAQILLKSDAKYPRYLSKIDDAPVLLFYRGNLPDPHQKYLAVVGTRLNSALGKQMTETIVPQLCAQGLSIASGLARGIDTIAHHTALKRSGQTVAVLGNGIDSIYPPSNRKLADEIIASGGCIFSEFVPKTKPNPYNFPRRNRIVSGLSLGVLVVEGKVRSGSLITARLALEQCREVFAIPGDPLRSGASGPNQLIRQGEAKLITEAEHIFQELQMNSVNQPKPARNLPDDPKEAAVWQLLSREACSFDDLVQQSGLSTPELTTTLSLLEMKGLAMNLGSSMWGQK